jgi:transcriptional regulator with XRE-family HTH domain
MADLVKLAQARDFASSGLGRLIRISSGISLREMARAIGADPAAVLRWEQGKNRPTGDRAVRWAEELSRLAERGPTPRSTAGVNTS